MKTSAKNFSLVVGP